MAEAKKFEIHEYVPEDKPGYFDDEVEALIEAEKTHKAPAITVQVPSFQKGRGENAEQVSALPKFKRFFQESAKKHDRSARLVSEKDNGDGSHSLEFSLRPKITRTRKPKDTETAEADTPEESAA